MVMVLDIDYFKFINDIYGYVVGDWIFKGVVEVLCDNLCVIDFVVWIGGEEFFVVLFEILI